METASEERADQFIGSVLLVGLLVSISVMVLGLLLAAIEGKSNTSTVFPLDTVVSHLLKGEPAAVLDTGILLLFATPLIGVVAALVTFLIRRNVAFTLVCLLLLVILAGGFAVALH